MIAGGVSGCSIGWLLLGSNRLAGAMTGTAVGAIAGGILGLIRIGPDDPVFLPESGLWDREVDQGQPPGPVWFIEEDIPGGGQGRPPR